MKTTRIIVFFICIFCQIAHIVEPLIQISPINSMDCGARMTTSPDGSILISTNEEELNSSPPQECSYNIESSQEEPSLLQVQNGSLSGTDYIYIDRGDNACTETSRYFSFQTEELDSCEITVTKPWQLYFKGKISLKIQESVTDNKEIGSNMCTHLTSTCSQLRRYSRVIRCKRDINPEFSNRHLRCKLSTDYSSSCTYQLQDKAVQSKCTDKDNEVIHNYNLLIFPNMSGIAYLDISGQNLAGFDVGTFSNVGPFLPVYINLTNNVITDIQTGAFYGLDKVLGLFLDNNNLQVLRRNGFHGAWGLIRLKLISNSIAEIESGAFDNLTQIMYINLQDNQLTTLPEKVFNGLHELEHLDLGGNLLTQLPWNVFKDLSRLKLLNLTHNRLKKLPDFRFLENLRSLYLQENGLHYIVKKSFAGLPESLSLLLVDQPEICECYVEGFEDSCRPEIQTETPYLPCGRLLAEVALVCFTWIIGLAALLGNLFVICWRRLAKEQENQIQSLLLRNLALSDLLMGIYMLIITTVDVHYGEYFPMWSQQWRKSGLCKLAGTLAITSSEASVFFITLISIDRFLCIRYPSPASRYHTTKIWLAVWTTWIIAFTLGVVPSVLSGRNPDFYDNSHVCIGLPLARNTIYGKRTTEVAGFDHFDSTLDKYNQNLSTLYKEETLPTMYFSTAIFLGVNMFCFLIVFVCYMEIIRTVRQSLKRNQRDMKRQVQLTLRVSAIVATDFCTWCPIIIIGILVQLDLTEISPRVFAWMVTIVLPINSAINPYLYTLATVIANHLKATLGKESLENVEVQALTRLRPDHGTKTSVSLISQSQRNEEKDEDQI